MSKWRAEVKDGIVRATNEKVVMSFMVKSPPASASIERRLKAEGLGLDTIDLIMKEIENADRNNI